MNQERKPPSIGPSTSFLTIVMVVIKEIRLERNIHAAHIADFLVMQPSEYLKIENRAKDTNMAILSLICQYLHLPFSTVLAAAERYAMVFSGNDWQVHPGNDPWSDDLEILSKKFYQQEGNLRLGNSTTLMTSPQVGLSIINGPGWVADSRDKPTLPPVFEYALNNV